MSQIMTCKTCVNIDGYFHCKPGEARFIYIGKAESRKISYLYNWKCPLFPYKRMMPLITASHAVLSDLMSAVLRRVTQTELFM